MAHVAQSFVESQTIPPIGVNAAEILGAKVAKSMTPTHYNGEMVMDARTDANT